jgi:hypothetical protein
VPSVPRIAAIAALAVTLVAPAAAHAKKPAFKVTSSIDGKTVLPHRLRWIARPRIPAANVGHVDFLIDGKVTWIEHMAPYTYSDDEAGAHLGYLVTSWLKPGRHRFAVRVVATDGRQVTHSVTARVLAAPDVPAALAGTWQRTLTDVYGAPANGTPGNPTDTIIAPGTYTMVIDERMIQVRWPGVYHWPQSDTTAAGWITDSDFTLAGATLQALGPVTFRPNSDPPRAEAGWWCWQDGPAGSYTWSVSGSTLTLTPKAGGDPCGVRSFVWAGQWTRVG